MVRTTTKPSSEQNSQATTTSTVGTERAPDRFQTAALALLILIVLVVPTIFTPWTTECGRVKLLALHLGVLAGLGLILLQVGLSGRLSFSFEPLHAPIIAFLAIVAFSALMSPSPYAGLNELWRVAMFAGLYALTVYAVRTTRAVRVITVFCEVAAFLVCAYGIAQHFGYDVVTYSQSPQDRLFSSIGNPNMLAGFLILMFWLMVGIGLDTRSLIHRIILAGICAMILWCLVLTYTKGAWIAFALSGVLLLLWVAVGWHFPYSIKARSRKILLCLLAVAMLTGFAVFHRPILGRLYTLKDSASVRLVYWAGAVGVVREHPIMGSGAGAFQIVYPDKRPADFRAAGATYNTLHAHCEPLEVLTELGLVGLLVFGWILLVFYRTAFRTFDSPATGPPRGVLLGIVLGMTGLLMHNLVDVNLRWYTTPTFFWMFLGLTVCIHQMCVAPSRPPVSITFPFSLRQRLVIILGILVVLGYVTKSRVVDSYLSEVYFRQGTDLTHRGEWKQALARTDKAIALDPSNLRAHYQQAYCYYEQKMYGEAIRSYLHLEMLAPNFCQLQYNMAILYSLMGRWEEAAERFIKAEKSGIAPDGFSSAAFIAQLRSKSGEQEKYLAVLQKMVEMNPTDPLAHNRLGIYYYEREQMDHAAVEFRKAIENDNGYVPALNNLAGIYYRQKDYPKAIEICRRILEINPLSHKTRVNLGRAYYLTGDRERATQEWKKVLEADPKEREALACLKSLVGAPNP